MAKKNGTSKKTETTSMNKPTEPVIPVVKPEKSEAEKIWDEIRNLPIEMFGLPDQVVSQHCTFVTVEPNSLYLVIRSSATLPSLETAIGPKTASEAATGPKYTVELADKFVIVKRAPKPLFPIKRK